MDEVSRRDNINMMNVQSVWNPIQIITNLWKIRELIIQLTKREVSSRYKGSYLGILWSCITPILMLSIYTFVFSGVFNARWSVESSSKTEFALILFCGLTAFNIFSEVLSKASGLIINNANYVKKVVFPLESLPVVLLGSALVQAAISLIILLVAQFLLLGTIYWTIIIIPIVLLPILLLCLGLGWFLSSLGVFLRDSGYLVGIGITALMFLSPIFYPVSAIPKGMRYLYNINPLTNVIENIRLVVIWGQMPDWTSCLIGIVIGLLIVVLGYVWFQRTKKMFADIL
ncbi:ABC transporter permease [Cohnella suwonensis]|uniref:Transport permease protein n=1 Tax=Cohnella suwonensis TaxID=696072 RepID=A0ABW0LUZ2_9BACL